MQGPPRRKSLRAGLFIGLGAAVTVLLVVQGIAVVSGSRAPDPENTRHALLSAGSGPMPEEFLGCVEEVRLGRGETVEGALLAAGLERGRVTAALDGLDDLVDVRRIRPEDRFTLFRNRGGDLLRLEYQRQPEQRVVLEGTGSDYAAHVERLPVHRRLRRLQGEVMGSLYLSLTGAGGHPGLVVEFADLFSWDFDFFTDTRDGDLFEMLVEERVVGGEQVGYGRILAGIYRPVDSEAPLEAYHYAWGEAPDEGGYYQPNGRSVRKFFLKSPLNYRRISSHFSKSRFHPILKKYRPHLGVDYAAPSGTPVVALGNGRVTFAGRKGGYGKTVVIKHNATYQTQYGHLSGYGKGVRSGVRVRQGQVIGYVGSTGLSTGPHLDFRVQQNGSWINPLRLKGGESEPLPAARLPGFEAELERLREQLRTLAPGEAIPVEGGDPDGPAAAWARLDTPSAS